MVYSLHPLPQLAGLPEGASATPVLVPLAGDPRCASCRKPIDASNFLVSEAQPRQLPQLVMILSGRPHYDLHATTAFATAVNHRVPHARSW